MNTRPRIGSPLPAELPKLLHSINDWTSTKLLSPRKSVSPGSPGGKPDSVIQRLRTNFQLRASAHRMELGCTALGKERKFPHVVRNEGGVWNRDVWLFLLFPRGCHHYFASCARKQSPRVSSDSDMVHGFAMFIMRVKGALRVIWAQDCDGKQTP